MDIFKLYLANLIIPYCIYIMFYHIFKQYLELPKWLYTRIHCSVDCIVVTLLYCTTLSVFLIWLHFTISTSLGMYPKMDKWKIKIMMMMMMNKIFEKNSVWNSNKNSKVKPLSRHCTASCGSCHRESTNKNAASWVLLVSLHIQFSRNFGLKSEHLCCLSIFVICLFYFHFIFENTNF